MLKKSLALLSVSAAFFLNAQSISVIKNTTDIYSNPEVFGSSKYNAMAGSNGALGGDASSLLTNPAGIGVAIADDFSATLSVQGNKNESRLNGKSIGNTINKTNFGNGGGVTVFQLLTETPWKFVNIGANYSTQSIEDYVKTPGNTAITFQKNLLDTAGNPVVGNLAYQGHAYNRYGTTSKLNFGIGANYNNSLYFGLGLNFHDADIEMYDSAAFSLDLDNNKIKVYDKQYTPYSEKGSGFSATFGIIGKIDNTFRFGASIETPTWWQINRVYTEYYEGSGGYMYYDEYSEDRKLSTPLKATLSAAYVPNKNFSLNVDYTLGVTKPHYKVYGVAETELNNFFNDFYKNTSELKIGAEYRVKAWRLRGGYGFASSPFGSMTAFSYNDAGIAGDRSYSNFIVGKRNTLGLGLGYDFKSFYIDAAYQNVSTEYTNPFLYGAVVSNSPHFSTGYHDDFDVNSNAYAVSNVKNMKNNFFLTLGWKF